MACGSIVVPKSACSKPPLRLETVLPDSGVRKSMNFHFLGQDLAFPDPHLADEDGLLAIGGDLSVGRLQAAYSQGIFPWYSEDDPILWFSPDPRMTLLPHALKVSKSMERTRRSGKFEIRFNSAFEAVMRRCSSIKRKGQEGTWITTDMIAAYAQLHRIGQAHSVETFLDDKLVGGLYGVSLGRVFFGESMFHEVSDASKMALWALCDQLCKWDFELIDCQMSTPHLKSLGAVEMARDDFIEKVKVGTQRKAPDGDWGLVES